MNRHEQALNLVWVLLGSTSCAYSVGLGLWARSKPGSGLVPFLAGAIIGIVGLVRLVGGLIRNADGGKTAPFWATTAIRNRTLLVLVGFMAMAFCMPKLGFLVAAVLVTSFLLYVIEPRHPLKILGTAGATCLLVYGLFVVLLRVNLPRGLLGF